MCIRDRVQIVHQTEVGVAVHAQIERVLLAQRYAAGNAEIRIVPGEPRRRHGDRRAGHGDDDIAGVAQREGAGRETGGSRGRDFQAPDAQLRRHRSRVERRAIHAQRGLRRAVETGQRSGGRQPRAQLGQIHLGKSDGGAAGVIVR